MGLGLFGSDVPEVPEVPELPEDPELPELPELPEVPPEDPPGAPLHAANNSHTTMSMRGGKASFMLRRLHGGSQLASKVHIMISKRVFSMRRLRSLCTQTLLPKWLAPDLRSVRCATLAQAGSHGSEHSWPSGGSGLQ
jgi:hypothetical protein